MDRVHTARWEGGRYEIASTQGNCCNRRSALPRVLRSSAPDVITDWTQTGIDVMKAVNVAGKPISPDAGDDTRLGCPDSITPCRTATAASPPGIPGGSERVRKAAAAAAARRDPDRRIPPKARNTMPALGRCWRRSRTVPRGAPGSRWARNAAGSRPERPDQRPRHLPAPDATRRVVPTTAAGLLAVRGGVSRGE